MSKLKKLRDDLKDSLVEAGLWEPQCVITERQTDIWNDIALAIQSSQNGSVIVIGIANGNGRDDDNLVMELTIPVTILCETQLKEGAAPEEDLWEATVKHIHGLVLHVTQHSDYAFRFREFSDDVELGDGAASWIARQTVFNVRFTL